jgi:hypothetical protein
MVSMANAENTGDSDEDAGEMRTGVSSEKLRDGNEKAQSWVPLSF